MVKHTLFVVLTAGLLFCTSCDSNFFRVKIQNNSSDTLQVDYVPLEYHDSLDRHGGYRHLSPSNGAGSLDLKHDSLTNTFTFFIAPGRNCSLINLMNEELDHLSGFTLCRHLDVIKRSDTIISAKNRGTSAIFEKQAGSHEVNWMLVVE